MEKTSIWMRLGVKLTAERTEIEKIICGDQEALLQQLCVGNFVVGGDSYIPESVISVYNEVLETNFETDDVSFDIMPCPIGGLRPLDEQLRILHQKHIDSIRELPRRPEGWLSHIVYVEEEGDYPVYTMYKLEEVREDGSCTLFNPNTNERFTDRHLYEINIDWLDTLLRWYYECCSVEDEKNKN